MFPSHDRAGGTRYGTAAELGTALQTLTLTKDRSFTFTIDQGNHTEEMMVTKANKALKRQIDEVVMPEVDARRLAVMSAAGIANGATDATPASASNAYSLVLTGMETLSDAKVPLKGRIIYATPSFCKFLKLDSSFILASEMGQKVKFNGQVGEVDGAAVIMVPSSYFPANHEFIITHKVATVGPKKLQDFKIHDNPP